MRYCLILLLLLPALTWAQTSTPVDELLPTLPAYESAIPDNALEAAGFHAKDESATSKILPADDLPGGRAMRVVVTRKTPNRWEIGMNWRPDKAIAQDDVLLFAFRARNVAENQSVAGEINVGFRRYVQPYEHALNALQPIGGGWKQYLFPFSPDSATGPGDSLLIMNFGSRTQSIEIADVRLLNFGRRVSLKRLYDACGTPRQWGNYGKVVGEELSPENLWEMDAYSDIPAAPPGFDPAGSWTHGYSIWANHGYMYRGAKRLGYLLITREAGDPVRLSVEHEIVNDDGITHRVKAQASCLNDEIASPVEWSLASEFVHPLGDPLDELAARESATVSDGHLTRKTGSKETRLSLAGPVTADWSLFDAVQRLPFEVAEPLEFDMFEGFSLIKEGQSLRYVGPREITTGEQTRTLHKFQQVGHGVLPYQYWLDDAHRLVMVITHSRAYLLDEQADQRHLDYMKNQQGRYRRFLDAHSKAAGK